MSNKNKKPTPSVIEQPKEVAEVKEVIIDFEKEIAPHSWYGDAVVLKGSKDGVQLLVKPDYCLSASGFIYNTAFESHFFKSEEAALKAWEEHQDAGVQHQLHSDKASEPIV